MRVRQFELRLLAVALTVLWAVGGGIVLIAYRPGGPVDLLVGVAASLPLLLCVAAVVWPPLVRSDQASAGVFWLGLAAGLLLVPSIGGVAGQVVAGGTQPLMPSLEVVYPWALALLATSLFAGLGVSRQAMGETGIGRRRLGGTLAFAVVTTSVIALIFSGVTLADEAALRDRPTTTSRYGPTSATLVPAACNLALAVPASARLALDMWADVDVRSVGNLSLSGVRSGSDFSWTAQVVRGSDPVVEYAAARIGSGAWTLAPGGGWQQVSGASLDRETVDLASLSGVLSPGNRATAENRGYEYVEGARARHCRNTVDGSTFGASFPQGSWLVGDANLATWRGELDYWVFGHAQRPPDRHRPGHGHCRAHAPNLRSMHREAGPAAQRPCRAEGPAPGASLARERAAGRVEAGAGTIARAAGSDEPADGLAACPGGPSTGTWWLYRTR